MARRVFSLKYSLSNLAFFCFRKPLESSQDETQLLLPVTPLEIHMVDLSLLYWSVSPFPKISSPFLCTQQGKFEENITKNIIKNAYAKRKTELNLHYLSQAYVQYFFSFTALNSGFTVYGSRCSLTGCRGQSYSSSVWPEWGVHVVAWDKVMLHVPPPSKNPSWHDLLERKNFFFDHTVHFILQYYSDSSCWLIRQHLFAVSMIINLGLIFCLVRFTAFIDFTEKY